MGYHACGTSPRAARCGTAFQTAASALRPNVRPNSPELLYLSAAVGRCVECTTQTPVPSAEQRAETNTTGPANGVYTSVPTLNISRLGALAGFRFHCYYRQAPHRSQGAAPRIAPGHVLPAVPPPSPAKIRTFCTENASRCARFGSTAWSQAAGRRPYSRGGRRRRVAGLVRIVLAVAAVQVSRQRESEEVSSGARRQLNPARRRLSGGAVGPGARSAARRFAAAR